MREERFFMTKELSVKRERNYGIDLLRMVSMILVAVLHVLGQGGVISEAGKHTPFNAYKVAWFLEIAAFCAVNCYAAISGYVGIKSKFKYSNIIYLWLQVIVQIYRQKCSYLRHLYTYCSMIVSSIAIPK